jgi:DNA-damage-inducible protein J
MAETVRDIRSCPHLPNSLTAQALEDLDSGKGKRFDSADELFKDLGI